MIYNDNLAENNQKLTGILNLVNKLPEVGYRVDDFINKNNLIQNLTIDLVGIRDYSFFNMDNLISIQCFNLLEIPEGAFWRCQKLTSINAPKVTRISYSAFREDLAIKELTFLNLESIGPSAFRESGIKKIKSNHLRHFYEQAFYNAGSFSTLIINNETKVGELDNSNVFSGTPIEAGTGYIYVPQSLIDQYKTALNWSVYANQFRAIEDYPEICN